MADNKNGREKQAHDEQRRQREREIRLAVERMDETEPPIESTVPEDLESDLDSLSFPATAADVRSAVGDYDIQAANRRYTVEELLPETEQVTFEAPEAVKERLQRPTIAATMKRVLEASKVLPDEQLKGSQWDAYEKTFRALAAIEADDDDEGIDVMADWIVDRIEEKSKLPGSRAVRREAAKYCRSNGYEIRTDEWLGV